MSEFINNSELRKLRLQELIRSLHEGKTVDEVKDAFQRDFKDVSTTEISAIEQALVKEGLPIEDVQRLCDVHATVFEGSIAEIHKETDYTQVPGHPTNIMKIENAAIETLIQTEIEPYLEPFVLKKDNQSHLMLRVGIDRLALIDRHYGRKEYLLFPYLEQHGITAPPKVMWGVDDEIRLEIKALSEQLSALNRDHLAIKVAIESTMKKVRDMIFKEDQILIPLMLETFTFFEWIQIDKAMPEFGYTLITPTDSWAVKEQPEVTKREVSSFPSDIRFDAGSLSALELNSILNTIPFDMTFVDHQDNVKYFTRGSERIFDRPLTIIGRNVSMCHPPHSVHVVEGILADFKSGKKNHEDFWIRMKGEFIHIRYFAIRGPKGEYLGTLELTQNIKPITELQGEKRLVSN